MPTLAIRAGMSAMAGDMNVAAVGQMLLNRLLSDNSSEVLVQDIADACHLSLLATREALYKLHASGMIDTAGDDPSQAEKVSVSSLTLHVNVVHANNLFTVAGLEPSGMPSLLREPVYRSGYWYQATITDNPDQETGAPVLLEVSQRSHGLPWVVMHTAPCADHETAHDQLAKYLTEWRLLAVDAWPQTLTHDGTALPVEESTRQHDGETVYVLDLVGDKGVVYSTTGATRDEAYQALLAWHCRVSDPRTGAEPKPAKGGRRKKEPSDGA